MTDRQSRPARQSFREQLGLGKKPGSGPSTNGIRPTAARPADYSVWIGLDFGTATTKAVVQIEDRRTDKADFLVVGWAGETRADSVVLLPSQIRREKGGGFTGAGGIIELNDRTDVSVELKTRLLDAASALAPDGICNTARCRSNSDFIDALMHLSMCLASIREAVRAHLGESNFKTHVQCAAPLEPGGQSAIGQVSEESRPAAAVFRELGFRALRGSRLVTGWELDAGQAAVVIEAAFAELMPAPEESPVTLIPEALAAVAAYLENADVRSHLFATVDVGGSTTDVAFAWYQSPDMQREGEPICWYQAMTTTRVGTNELVDAVFGPDADGRAFAHAELARRPTLTTGDAAIACHTVVDEIHDAYREGWKRALNQHNEPLRIWIDGRSTAWTLLLLGGGTDLDLVEASLAVPPGTPAYFDTHRDVQKLGVPGRLTVLSSSGRRLEPARVTNSRHRDPVHQSASMLVVAYGLARRAPDFPGWERYEQVKRHEVRMQDRDYAYLMDDSG